VRRLVFLVLLASCSTNNGRSGDGGAGGGDGGRNTDCANGADTTIVGTLFAPNGLDPVPNATIYVPAGDPQPYSDGIACDLCGSPAGGIVSTVTRFDGGFTLTNAPAGPVKVVAELGRFRRVVTMNVTACQPNIVPKDPGVFGIRLPGKDADQDPADHVPRIAVASGDYDQIECVLDRMGISQLDLYDDRYTGVLPATQGKLFDLLNDRAKLEKYNVVVINCTSAGFDTAANLTPTVLQNLEHYVRNGGRLYATDWAYDFINQVPEFAPYMCFVQGGVDGASPPTTCPGTPQSLGEAHSNTSWNSAATVHDQTLASWLGVFPNTIVNGEVPVQFNFVVINHVGDAMHPTTVWLDGDAMDPGALPQQGKGVRPMTVTFDYQQCGRVHYSTYNTEPAAAPADNATYRYPTCNNRTDFNPQERLLEYFIFETAQCVGPIG
jgi:hypothetical protein